MGCRDVIVVECIFTEKVPINVFKDDRPKQPVECIVFLKIFVLREATYMLVCLSVYHYMAGRSYITLADSNGL